MSTTDSDYLDWKVGDRIRWCREVSEGDDTIYTITSIDHANERVFWDEGDGSDSMTRCCNMERVFTDTISITVEKVERVKQEIPVNFPYYIEYGAMWDYADRVTLYKVNRDGTCVQLTREEQYSTEIPPKWEIVFEPSGGTNHIAYLFGNGFHRSHYKTIDEKRWNEVLTEFKQAVSQL